MPKKMTCQGCRLEETRCICPQQPPISSLIEVLVIRHALEIHRSSGSARLIPLVISNASIIDIGKRGVAPPTEVSRGRTALLFPGGVPISKAAPIDRLVVLDGSWGQARRMRYRLKCLSNLRTVTIPDSGRLPQKNLRKPRYAGELPTALALAQALKALGEPMAAAALQKVYTSLYDALKRDRGLL